MIERYEADDISKIWKKNNRLQKWLDDIFKALSGDAEIKA